MAIKNYPNRIYKKTTPAIDRVMAKRNPVMVTGQQDITSNNLSVMVSSNNDWIVDSVAFTFSNSASRTYGFSIQNGRKVVQNYNDYLWVRAPGALAQMIVLAPGFYTGTQLAAQLQTQLNANTAYVALALTFTVTYDNNTGLFTITPSTSTIQYLNVNDSQTLRTRDSIAGHLFGFNVDTVNASSISSDTPVAGLDNAANIINAVNSTVLTHYHDDPHPLSIDQAVRLSSNGGSVAIGYAITYEEMV